MKSIDSKRETTLQRIFPEATGRQFKALMVVAVITLGAAITLALWAAATGRSALFTALLPPALAAAAVARDCDEAAGGVLSK